MDPPLPPCTFFFPSFDVGLLETGGEEWRRLEIWTKG